MSLFRKNHFGVIRFPNMTIEWFDIWKSNAKEALEADQVVICFKVNAEYENDAIREVEYLLHKKFPLK